jgi:hypothetical protein
MNETQKILAEVEAERKEQDVRHGGSENDNRNCEGDWHRWINEHLGMSSRNVHAGTRGELIRVAALAVAAVESFDRNKGFPH